MFSRVVKYLIFFAVLIVDSELDVRVKRNDIDLQTCINKFNLHKDKIIRTQDSQNMGAKYLNEIDLGSREECLHLCCETENCDVFVFEEKNAGSCYLFHCGPPEDFKCKFTHHVNYSSAILSINRHLPDLESQIKLTKHEQDLTKLRKTDLELETPVHMVHEIRTTPITTTNLPRLREVIPVSSNKKIPEEDPKCTRFQFECRSSRECIAIYNACDGIPQCSDGSDEGPELGCPELVGTTPPTFPVHSNNLPVQPLLRYDNNVQQINNNQQGMYIQPPQMLHDNNQLLSPILRTEADFLRPGNVNINPRLSSYDAPALQPYMPQLPPQGQTNWMPHQTNQMPPQITQYAGKSRRYKRPY
ncbi:unnamed protein product [Psylliodes chrysocephalus]|uniref:MANSC domain-containing protein n=1 Tax=Psylliodes chrysocephalus TaxID=3402493 RepID=A0A9P0CG89_9CUCU|nr:unnamed protein product [Psylliodes chrysocephala]